MMHRDRHRAIGYIRSVLLLAAVGLFGAAGLRAQSSEDQPPPPGVFTPAEQAYLTNYLGRLNYMVYYNEAGKLDPRSAKMAIAQANRYLIEKMGFSVIDLDQIEKNKKDQQTAYEHETGGSISIIQYLAEKFNADVYVEIDLGADTRNPTGTMKIFDVSTAALLGSVAFQNPGLDLVAAVWDVMPKLAAQSKELLRNSLQRGIRYEVIIQKTPDARQLSNLRRALAKKIREVEQVSYSPEETKLHLYTFQGRDKVEDAVYDAADAAKMPDFNLIYSRGKSFTFTTGL